jgi:hypothetical protein
VYIACVLRGALHFFNKLSSTYISFFCPSFKATVDVVC